MVLAKEASQILGHYISGEDFDQIERETGCSLSTIRAFLSGFDEDVLQTLRSFRELVDEFDESPELIEALEGAKLNRELSELGVEREQLEDFVHFSEKATDGSPKIIQEAVKLSELEEETGTPYEEAVERYEELRDEASDLKRTVESLRREKGELEEELEETDRELESKLEETELTLKKLDEVTELKEDLEERGKEIADLQELVDFYDRCAEMDFDPKTVSSMVDLSNQMGRFGVSREEISEFLRKNNRLEDLGFDLEAANYLAERLQEYGDDPKEASEKMMERFKESELLDKQMEELRTEREDLKTKINSVEEAFTEAENRFNSVKEEIQELERRRDSLVDREAELEGNVMKKKERNETLQQELDEKASALEGLEDIEELEERKQELKEIVSDLEDARGGALDEDLDDLYLRIKKERDSLFEATSNFFRESTYALVYLAKQGDFLSNLSKDDRLKLLRRMDLLERRDGFGEIKQGEIQEIKSQLVSDLETDAEKVSEEDGTLDLRKISDMTVL